LLFFAVNSRAAMREQTGSPDFNIDTQNKAILEEFRDRDMADVRTFEAAAFERLVAAVEALSEENLFEPGRFAWVTDDTLATAVGWDSTTHYPAHLSDLRG
jgi:hypothetical protein